MNWIWGERGVLFQGQGLSADKTEYVTKDWNASTDQKIVFTYGKGGRWGVPRTWETVATGDPRLKPNACVKIDAYPDKGPFEVNDTGEQVGNSHLDIYIGEAFLSVADALGMKNGKVSVQKSGPSQCSSN